MSNNYRRGQVVDTGIIPCRACPEGDYHELRVISLDPVQTSWKKDGHDYQPKAATDYILEQREFIKELLHKNALLELKVKRLSEQRKKL